MFEAGSLCAHVVYKATLTGIGALRQRRRPGWGVSAGHWMCGCELQGSGRERAMDAGRGLVGGGLRGLAAGSRNG